MLDFQTAKNLIMSKDKILLLTHQKMDIDGLSSILTLGTFLENLGKEVKIISTDEIPDSFEFLPFTKKVQVSKNATKDFTISLKLNGAYVDKLKYNTEGDKLNIVINSKNGEITQEGITFAKGIGKFDLIICADTASLENLGDLYFENTNLFFETPVINIDHHATNEGFGQINLVDVTSASSTMIIFDLIKNFSENWKEIIDEDIATLLMAGLITDTGSFQHNNTSPKALECAADLMDLGARQQEIIKHVYKTKQLSMLKIWGKILTNVKEDPISRIVWSSVNKDDFIETGASIEEADGLIDELMSNAPGSEIIILAKEGKDKKIHVSLRSNSIAADVAEIAQENGGGGHKAAAGFVINDYQNFHAEIGKFIENIQIKQKNRLGISEEEVEKIEKENKEKSEEIFKKNLESNSEETKKSESKFSGINVKLDLPEVKKEENKKPEIKQSPKTINKNISEKSTENIKIKQEKKPEFKKSEPIKQETKKDLKKPQKTEEEKANIVEENRKKQIEDNKRRQEEKRKTEEINRKKEEEAKKIEAEKVQKEKEEKIKKEKIKKDKLEKEKIEKEKIETEKNTKQEIKTTETKIEDKKELKSEPKIEKKSENDSMISPQEADKHARNFYDLLQKTPQDDSSYKKYYESYMYYGKLAGWPGM